jgi:hypothetical protein
MGIKKKCHVRKIVILAIHGLLVMRWNWYIDTCHILLTYHGDYLEKLRKIVILVHFLYFHDDVIMWFELVEAVALRGSEELMVVKQLLQSNPWPVSPNMQLGCRGWYF